MLDAPVAPPTGARVSRLEEVPSSLRSRPAASQPARPARGGRAVPPELAPRRTSNPEQAARPDEQDELKIVTDEQAFSVETPGGGVVGRQAEDRSYRAEPKTALGGGN
ncbi:hypothetical protein [Micromonospora sp. 15K316]|uniref:hypothetical protein n=1 Tax=Micromonospora sp. 15K316 TaxID=2530376 RepID=UPI00104DDDDC|nr:hypothetical protein [Micromonospora sp. 15K316]